VTDGGGGGGGGGIHGFMIRLEFRAIIGPLIDADTGKINSAQEGDFPFHSRFTLKMY
jgi:hypothetical protein